MKTLSKRYVGGDVTFKASRANYTNHEHGMVIANKIVGINSIDSKAKFILLVEKYSVMHMLLEYGLFDSLGTCIVITGQGIPALSPENLCIFCTNKYEYLPMAYSI